MVHDSGGPFFLSTIPRFSLLFPLFIGFDPARLLPLTLTKCCFFGYFLEDIRYGLTPPGTIFSPLESDTRFGITAEGLGGLFSLPPPPRGHRSAILGFSLFPNSAVALHFARLRTAYLLVFSHTKSLRRAPFPSLFSIFFFLPGFCHGT